MTPKNDKENAWTENIMEYNSSIVIISLDHLETYEVGRCEQRGEPEPSRFSSSLVNVAVHIRFLISSIFIINSVPNENTLHKAPH